MANSLRAIGDPTRIKLLDRLRHPASVPEFVDAAVRVRRTYPWVEGIFYEERTPTQLALARGVKRSMINNTGRLPDGRRVVSIAEAA